MSDLAILKAALAAIDAADAASAVEGERFRLWMEGEKHINSVRAAERKTTEASYAAYEAVHAAVQVDERIAENWGFSTQEPEVRAAIERAIRERS